MKNAEEEEKRLTMEISAIISLYNNGELEVSEEETEVQVMLRLVRRAVLKHLGIYE